MRVTVTEALRIKNEIAGALKKYAHFSPKNNPRHSWMDRDEAVPMAYGVMQEDGKPVTAEDKESCAVVAKKLEALLTLSSGVNSAIASFNTKSGLADCVRERQNALMLVRFYENVQKNSKTQKYYKYEVVGNERKAITVEFAPHMDAKTVTDTIAFFKDRARQMQQAVDKLNVEEIELVFSAEELEAAIK